MVDTMYPLYTEGKLDPQSEVILKQIAESNSAPLSALSPQKAREYFLDKSWLGIPEKSINIKKMRIPSSGHQISIHIYMPEEKQLYPILIFFHGGGFVLGFLDEFDPFCTFLASGASCIVVSVGYRLAPEHKHPAALEDAVAAIQWIVSNAKNIQGDRSRIALAGDSAGGNLATVSSIIARDQGFPKLVYQVFICPWVNASSFNTASYHYFGDGLWLSKANMIWYHNHYLQNQEQALSPLVSPLLEKDLSGLPPALIITAEFDVLRDEAEVYANCLRRAGVPVQCTSYNGMLHDFVTLPGVFPRAKDAIDEVCTTLQATFSV